MTRNEELYLQDILLSIRKIEKYTKGMTFSHFKKDEKTVDSVIRNLEIIGEAARNIGRYFKTKYPDIPWRELIGMRNKVIHEYFGVDLEILWKTVQEDISFLKRKIKDLSQE